MPLARLATFGAASLAGGFASSPAGCSSTSAGTASSSPWPGNGGRRSVLSGWSYEVADRRTRR
ncbi:MAG: hypothetical protein ACRDOH_30235, partial [Streptosporangiaceae bacterium]